MRLQDLNNIITTRSGSEKKLTTFSYIYYLRLLTKEGLNRKYSRYYRRLLANVALLVYKGIIFRGPAKKKVIYKKYEYYTRKKYLYIPVSIYSLFAALLYTYY